MSALTRLTLRRKLRVPDHGILEHGYWTLFSRVIVGARFYHAACIMVKASDSRGVYNTNSGIDSMQLQPNDPVMVYDIEDVHPYPELPVGLEWTNTHGVTARCRSCGQDYQWPVEPEEYSEEGNYCGGSPSCIP